MPRVLQLEDKTGITIDTESCGSGGSGDVFKIISPSHLTNQVVKLYHKDRLTKEAENKIRHLVSKKINQGEHESIVWIKNVVLDNGKFAGFTMNYADGIGLEQFLNDRWWRKNDTKDWDKFKLENEKGIENRIRLCSNIAIAINIIHKNGNYTITDIKPSNFKVQKNGLVSIIDIDNIEVIENGKILYVAQVITPEYSPPEFHNGLDYKKTSASQNWDRYSLSILFYHILCGIHPFQFVKYKKAGEEYTDAKMIAEGLFLFGNKSHYLEPAHPQHKSFLNLSNEIKSLFIQCFENGHNKPQLRPSAEDWCRVFDFKTVVIKRPSIAELIAVDINYSAKFKNVIQFNVYSASNVLKSNVEILHTDVKFHNLSNELSFFDKIVNVFKKSQKQLLIDELNDIEVGITGFLHKQSAIKSDTSTIISEFEKKQQEIKTNERSQIDTLKKSLQLVLNDAEYLATKAHSEESKEITELQNQINSLIQKEDIALANHHSSIYGDLINNFEKKRADYNATILNYDIDKRNEIERLVSSPNKLNHYNLERDCVKIFHGNLLSVINALKQLNFITAADFSKVYSDGYLLNRYNKTIKIPGMGSERANKLHYWRIKIEETENNIIIRDTTDKYNKLKNEVSLKWNSIESSHNQTLSPLNTRFKGKEVEIKRNKDRLIETKEAEVNRIKLKFDNLHIDLKNEFIKALNKFYLDIENIYRQTKIALLNNLSIYESQLKAKESQIQETNEQIDTELRKYNLLYLRLSQTRQS
jgi:hypothetical protein